MKKTAAATSGLKGSEAAATQPAAGSSKPRNARAKSTNAQVSPAAKSSGDSVGVGPGTGTGAAGKKQTAPKKETAPHTASGKDAAAQTTTPVKGSISAMRYTLVHDIPGRLRLRRAKPGRGCPDKAQALEAALAASPVLAGADIAVSPVTGSILVHYTDSAVRNEIFAIFCLLEAAADGSLLSLEDTAQAIFAANKDGRKKSQPEQPVEEVAVRNPIPGKAMSYFYPRIFVQAVAVLRSIPYMFSAVKALFRGKLNLEVLDGAALAVCLLRRDFKSLGSIVFFFALGEFLADWTRKKSRASLAESLALNIDHVWIREGDLERQVSLSEVTVGDVVVVRAGSVVPVDGTVAEGDGMVNQASMTGESMPVHRTKGSSVYAGTVLEEGELAVTATKVGSDTRITSILRTIEESESVKASIQGRYERVADAIVPYNFLLSGAVYAATRDTMRAGSVLLVDYSCAIRLATPLTIFTAMREAAEHGVLIKGGKFMEAVAEADVVVFDKTGTLTEAKPTVIDVIPFGNRDRATVLRVAACLEEHFVHPVGQAVVRAAEQEGLKHREEHTQVEFVVAHGIASRWKEQRVLIGSEHFVLEDERIPISKEQQALIDAEAAKGRSILYLAMGEELAGILLIEDKIRDDAATIVQALRADGIKRVIMLTGDGTLTAKSIAERAGITEFRSRLLPEDKALYIESLKKEGYKVIMVGDGINDSPALSAANVGVAMADGADMAREVADMVLVNGELSGLLLARKISRRALCRVRSNFHTSLFWNSMFLVGGLLGVLMPGISALLHNATTAAIAVSSVRPLLAPMDEPVALPARQPC